MLVRQILCVAGANDLGAWVVTQQKGWKGYRGTVGLERPRWHIDDQPLGLTPTAGLEFRRNEFDVPVLLERGIGV